LCVSLSTIPGPDDADRLPKGIHNVAIVIPQFLVTGLSSIIFAFFEAGVSGVHPGAGHAGAGLGGVVEAPTATATGAAAALSTAAVYGGADPDIGFDEKGGDGGPMRMLARSVARRAAEMMMVTRAEGVEGGGGSPDGIGLVFRIGGISSFIACFLCWRLARDLRRRG
jgi:solute carrier family 45, member 1/2/4